MSKRTTDFPAAPITGEGELIPAPPAGFVPLGVSEREAVRIRAERRPARPVAADLVTVKER